MQVESPPQQEPQYTDQVEPRLGVRRLVESGNDRLDELAREADHALVLGLHARPGLDHQASDIDCQSERQHQRQQEVDPRPQG